MKFAKSLLVAALTILAAAPAAKAAPIDSINAAEPLAAATWNAVDIGWFYTPTFSYTLTGIGTKFGSSSTQIVTAEIFTGSPGELTFIPSTLTLLSSGTLTPVANKFVDAQITSVTLTAGTRYFIGFENVRGLALDVTNAPGATALPGGLRSDLVGNNMFNFIPEIGDDTSQPLLEFEGTRTAVPEPGALALFGIGLAGMAWARRRNPA